MQEEKIEEGLEGSRMASEEEMAKIYGQTLKDFEEGQIVKGKIVTITPKEVIIDIGYKSEGIIPLSEFSDPHSLKVGDEMDVLLESKESEEGMVVLSKIKADRMHGWTKIVGNYSEGHLIEGKVAKKVKGGFIVDIGGIEAFLPASLSAFRGNPNDLIGKTMKFKIVSINKSRKNIVISRREAMQMEKEEIKVKLLDSLKVGEIAGGTVKNVTDFGAFIDLGGTDGLLHITDMSWSRINHPSEVVVIGDKIDVVVLGVDKESGKVSLGLKQKTPDPWLEVETKFPLGSKVKGKVVNLVPYGIFVELEKGIEALVHISELSWTKRISDPSELFAIGDVVEAVVLSVDSQNRKISLGIKQMEVNPWLDVESKYPSGTKVKGKVRSLTDYGAFVELEEGIDGLIHASDMSWTRRIGHPEEILKKGQKIEAIVLSVDGANKRISLGLKQLTPDSWPEIAQKFLAGTILEGKVTKLTNFGIFVELEGEVEGLVHISEIERKTSAKLEDSFKVGDAVKVRVLKVDVEQRKIALSMKEI